MDYKIELVVELLQEMSKYTFEFGSRHWVDVVHVNNPHSFYVRPRELIKYLPLLHCLGDRPDIADVNVGEVFGYRSWRSDSIVRGKIISCEKTRENVICKMFAIDFGYIEESVTLDRIWNTDYSLQVAPLVIHCRLVNCGPVGEAWDPLTINAMITYVEGKKCTIMIRGKTPDCVLVKLYTSHPDDISTVLAENYPKSVKIIVGCETKEEDDIKDLEHYFPTREVQVGEILNVTIQAGSLFQRFYALPIEDNESCQADKDKYTANANSECYLKINEISINLPVGFFYEKNNKYERGIVQKFLPKTNTVRVLLVDLGITVEASVLKLKKVPTWYLEIPTKALFCTLHGNQIFTNSVPPLQHPDEKFEMTIIAIGDDGLNCPHVVRLTPLEESTYL